jgi:AcrR family transcriptional regulator
MARKAKPRPYHHGNLYEALVTAGTSVLKDVGVEGFTLRECARRAGVSHAAPKNHFNSIDDLLAEIAARGFDQFVVELDTAANAAPLQTPDARLIAMGEAYVRFANANPEVYGLMFRRKRELTPSDHLQQAARAAWVQLEAAVQAIIGVERADSAERAAHVWSLVHGISSLLIDRRFPPHIDPTIVITQSLASLPSAIRGLGTA